MINIKSALFYALTFASTSAVFCCSEQDEQVGYVQSPLNTETGSIRSYSEALEIAKSAVSMFDDDATTRTASTREISLSDSKVYLKKSATRGADNINDTLMYVFNFEGDQGFAIVSASRETEPLLAMTETGYYDPSENCDNEGFSDFMKLAEQYVIHGDETATTDWETRTTRAFVNPYTLHHSVPQMLHVYWGQQNIEGTYCPNGVCGCGPTAMAMLMSYYGYPTTINLSHDSFNVPNYALDWVEMKKHHTIHTNTHFFCNANDNAHDMIAHLCRQLGETAGSTYYIDPVHGNHTSTDTSMIANCMYYYGFSGTSWLTFSEAAIVNKLNMSRPVIMIGRTNQNGGHAWIVDGYKCYSLTGGPTQPDDYTWDPVYKYYNHVNWGWQGDSNGYFLANVFNTTSADSYDEFFSHMANYNFINQLQYMAPYISL